MAAVSMPMLPGSGLPASVALTAPHLVCPSTTMVCTPSACTPYSNVPLDSWLSKLPATRFTNRSPTPMSKMISTGTRESAQLRTPIEGICPSAPVFTTCSCCHECDSMPPPTKRLLPASSSLRASACVVPGEVIPSWVATRAATRLRHAARIPTVAMVVLWFMHAR